MNFSIFIAFLFSLVATSFVVFFVSAQQQIPTAPVTTFGPNSVDPTYCNNVANNFLMYSKIPAPTTTTTTTTTTVVPSSTDSSSTSTTSTSTTTIPSQTTVVTSSTSFTTNSTPNDNNNTNSTPPVATTWAVPSESAPAGKPMQVSVPLLPITFKAMAYATSVAQTDVATRINQVLTSSPPLTPLGPPGSSYSVAYKFFLTLAAAADGQLAMSRFSNASFWQNIATNLFPASNPQQTKPYILDVRKITTTANTAPFAFSEILTQMGAKIEDLKERLATGYIVAVAIQSRDHQNGVCTAFLSPPEALPWPLIQSRTMLAIVVGIDAQYVYLVDPCYQGSISKIKIDVFMQRWHNYEYASSSSSNSIPVSANQRAFYFMGNNTGLDSSSSKVLQDQGTNWRNTAKMVFIDSRSTSFLLSDVGGPEGFDNVQSA